MNDFLGIYLLGVCLALAALLTANLLASVLTTTVWRLASRSTTGWSAGCRARFIFVLRTFPAAAALLAVVVFLIPSYLAFEPRQTGETVSVKLGLLALLSATSIALACWRGVAAWVVTRRLIGNWKKHSENLCLAEVSIPAYRINHRFPVVAVVGVFRPKLFVARQIFDSLNADELAAVIAHETAHVAARDNLKHWLMRICRDVLVIIPFARALDKEWAEATELAADEEAASRKDGATALDLAQALIKIARLVPKGGKPTMPAGAFLIGEGVESGDALTNRIRRLTQLADENTEISRSWRTRLSRNFIWICFSLLLLGVGITVTDSDILAKIHTGAEQLVKILS